MNRAIRAIRMVGKLDARGKHYTEDDIGHIENALDEEISAMVVRLRSGVEGQPGFKLARDEAKGEA